MPNLNAMAQTKVFGLDGITVTIGAVVVVIALFLILNMMSKKRR